MSNNGHAPSSPYARWREHRRRKRQQAIEREFFDHQRAQSAGISASTTSADLLNAHTRANAYGTVWTTFFTGLGGGP